MVAVAGPPVFGRRRLAADAAGRAAGAAVAVGPATQAAAPLPCSLLGRLRGTTAQPAQSLRRRVPGRAARIRRQRRHWHRLTHSGCSAPSSERLACRHPGPALMHSGESGPAAVADRHDVAAPGSRGDRPTTRLAGACSPACRQAVGTAQQPHYPLTPSAQRTWKTPTSVLLEPRRTASRKLTRRGALHRSSASAGMSALEPSYDERAMEELWK